MTNKSMAVIFFMMAFSASITFAQATGPGGAPGSGTSGGSVSSVSNSDGTQIISPNTGGVVSSINLGHANTWTATQTFAVINGSGFLTINDPNQITMLAPTALNGANLSSGNFILNAVANATSGSNQASLNERFAASYFNVSAQTDYFQFTNTPADNTTTPVMNLKLTSNGSSGAHYLDLTGVIGIKANAFIATGSAPTIANGAAAGTSPGTPTVTGSNTSGVITVITGTATTASATLATVTFNGTLGTAPQTCNLFPRNAAAALQSAAIFATAPSTTAWTIAVGGTAVAVSTTMSWGYHCL